MRGKAKRSGIRPTHSARYLVSHWPLLWRVTRQEWAARYAGSILGATWLILFPLAILAVYGAVYLLIFRVQVPGLTSVQYVLYVFSGLIPYLVTAESLTLGLGSVLANRHILNNTVFPIDLVPVRAVLTSQGTMIVGLCVVLVGSALTGSFHWTVVLLPLLWLLHLLALVGATWVLSLGNVLVRDLQSVMSLILMVLLIASPIAYVPEMVPKALRPLFLLNPFSYLVTAYQDILILGRVPGLAHALVLLLGPLCLFIVGGYFFSYAKSVIVDHV